ncbi:MAG TPA: FkbM family methyltransferase [Gammaproteobacteria bacterium]|nr:FkbM family methyltransferase [Gammaproteobacteria bacterium]
MKKLAYEWKYSDYLNPGFLSVIDRSSVHTIFELGSHDGVDTLKLREVYGATIHAFECHPELMTLARQRCSHCPDIFLVQKAAWDEDRTIPFYPVVRTTENRKVIDNIGASSCFQARTDYHRLYEQTRIMVDAVRIDTYWRQHRLPPVDMFCIDVQGAALHALKGCGEVLRQAGYIIIEIEHRPIYHGQDLFADVDAHLQAYGFRPVAEVARDAWFNDYLYVNNA